MTLADVLAPTGVDAFLRNYIGQNYLVVRGVNGRFQSLVTWPQLNDALSTIRVGDGRVSLIKNGQSIPRDAYVQTSQSGHVQYLIGPAITKHVRAGATLIFNQVDEVLPGIRRLAESCEGVFRVYTSANLYAGWRKDNGFNVHWDSHDTLIVQTMGRKDWKVWKPTRLHPLAGDSRDVTPLPQDEPVWQGTLEDGDMLYMPRGWWHVAYPRDEPSVHATIGLVHPTGMSLLTWILDQARELEAVRMDVPHWTPPEARTAWLRTLQLHLVEALTDDAIERFMHHLDDRAHARPLIHLPETATATVRGIAIDDLTRLRLTRGRRLHLERREEGGTVAFNASGREWQYPAALAPALALLNHVAPCTLSDMASVIDISTQPLLRPIITGLMMSEIIWAEQSQDSAMPVGHEVAPT